MRPYLYAAVLLASLLVVAACTDDESIEPSDIVSTIPWPDNERAEYVLFERDDLETEFGQGVLTITRQRGQFELRLHFEGGGDTDESVIVVDATTLKPATVRREVGREGTTVTGEYKPDEEIVDVIITDADGDMRTIPIRLEEPYFDNESSLFIWRSIPFKEGFKGSYQSVQTNQGQLVQVTLEVTGRQQISVPAGTFETWRVEIRIGGTKQVAWYADTPQRELVQYDNSRLIFQLTAIDGG